MLTIVSVSPSDEFMLSDSSDNLVAYRIVHVPDETKDQQLFQATTSSGSTTVPQQVQYFVIDNSNGIVQAVQSPQITVQAPVTATTSAPLKTEGTSNTSKLPKVRSSIAIAPKDTTNKPNVSGCYFFIASFFTIILSPIIIIPESAGISPNSSIQTVEFLSLRKRDEKREDRRRATHNEVERRRRDKINHWIMKLGSIIPADGKSHEIGNSGRISIAAIDGQSKGGILSKAFEYVQMLQAKPTAGR